MAALLSSCQTPGPLEPFEDPGLQGGSSEQTPAQREAAYSYWDDSGGGGQLSVTIDLSEQTAYFYRGKKQIGRSRVATGIPGRRTPRGSFTIIEKTVDKRSNLYGVIVDADGDVLDSDADSRRDRPPPGGRFEGASMPYWMRLTRAGVGMHMGPIPSPGNSASHGCIRMPREMAEALYENAPLGTPVQIVE